ncbi:TPA: hypothetical protein ACIK0B_000511 [Campylobacter jejuni]|uniref:hypothetical protein n=1 Tax=Campylobacter jejuni TaxID=197 RepID=UPI0009442048|nr:hypothetical protein [Campylobacter jejuni]ECP9346082.1 hypothetical protein [Campylobacter jejuni]EDO8477234.1 hypothetical protein [Campylobacter jejuni]EIP2954480.1 hypothetical protein [Campylobacter jejuni]EKR5464481.1 hypothetical protein [Campylobacter jejuni]MEA8950272.1 hypothetical protein [Campylobacter jejuni]
MNKISFINTLPKAPDMANPVDFDKDANNFVNALVPFSKELNDFIKDINILSASLIELNSNMISYTNLALEQIDSKTNINILKIENFCKDFQNVLEQKAKERLKEFTDECLTIVENKGYEMIERLNDNGVGADYIAISQSLAHSLSLERFIMERGFIKLRKEEALNLDDVNLSLEEQRRDINLAQKALENITNILSSQNEINLTLKGENNA